VFILILVLVEYFSGGIILVVVYFSGGYRSKSILNDAYSSSID